MRNLPHVVAFRVAADTKQLLERVAAAHGVSPSEYARGVVLNSIGAAATMPRVARRIMHGEELRAVLAELQHHGSNLNQTRTPREFRRARCGAARRDGDVDGRAWRGSARRDQLHPRR